MQLSKQDFSKLSKQDQLMILRKKNGINKKTSSKSGKPVTRNRSPPASSLLTGQSKGVAAAYAKGVGGNKPTINYRANGRECRVSHKEFLSNVVGSVNFTTTIQIPLNPGLFTSFPWLSAIANNFEQYRVNRMVFKYLTRTGSATPGSVLIYPDYDAADAAPASEQIASNYQEVCEDAPWKDISCSLRVPGMHAIGPKKFVRQAALAANLDIKTYDVGTLFLSTVDGTAIPWGKLWVEYDITFYEPQLNPNGPNPGIAGGSIVGGGVITAANPLGSIPVPDAQNALMTVDATSIITFQVAGTCVIAMNAGGTVLTGVTMTGAAGSVGVAGPTTVVNTAGTALESIASFNVLPNSTISFVVLGTTCTSSTVRIGFSPAGSQS